MANVINRIVIEKLYDIYDYDITFDRGDLSLLTGPNGYGKTTILNIVRNALGLNLWYFYNLLYSSIQIYWGDGTVLNIKKNALTTNHVVHDLFDDGLVVENSDIDEFEVEINHVDKDGNSLSSIRLNSERFDTLMDRHIPGIGRREFISRSRFSLENDERLSYVDREIRMGFAELRMFARQSNCMYVQAQRLFENISESHNDEIDPKDRYTVTYLAEKVKKMYHEEQSKYVEKSQQIDSTFIQRLIEDTHDTYSPEQYQKKLEDLKQKIANFEKYGLLDKYNLVEDYNEALGNVLSMHIDDMNDKFGVYDKIYDKLERFDKFVSGKGLSNKRMILDSENGITFVSDSGRVIPLHKLSSGEQNLVILYYRLVFETNNETLVLIDEPENSIHIEWLKEMLNDYLETVDKLKCQMIIATHSIPFIDGHWDIAYDLFKKLYQD